MYNNSKINNNNDKDYNEANNEKQGDNCGRENTNQL